MSGGSETPTKRVVDQTKLHGIDIDETQMTQQDVEFVAYAQRTAMMNIFGGAAIGLGLPFLAMRNRGGSRLMRGTTLFMGTMAGMLVGSARTTHLITQRVDTLSNDSYIKKLANSVLVDRYPMAVADTMEERRQAQQGK